MNASLFLSLYLFRRCYDFTVLNSTIQPPDQPCCESSVSSWFINFELFASLGILSSGKHSQVVCATPVVVGGVPPVVRRAVVHVMS